VPGLESLGPWRTVLPSGIPVAFVAGPALYRAASFSTKRLTSKSACWPMRSRLPSRYAVSDNGSSRLSQREAKKLEKPGNTISKRLFITSTVHPTLPIERRFGEVRRTGRGVPAAGRRWLIAGA